jgi:hypothetical protein
MQNFTDQADKNGVTLISAGKCQFCGADTTGGVYECVAIYSTGFNVIDFSKSENHITRFLSVDAHALQHSEIHGKWNNHFHLTRLHLILKLGFKWDYAKSPRLSDYLKKYKESNPNEMLTPPNPIERGLTTTTDVLNRAKTEEDCKKLITQWAEEVYDSWNMYHDLVDSIAKGFLKEN